MMMIDPSPASLATDFGRFGGQIAAIVFCWLLLTFASLAEAALVRLEVVRVRQLVGLRACRLLPAVGKTANSQRQLQLCAICRCAMHGNLSHGHRAALLLICRTCITKLIEMQVVLQQCNCNCTP